MIASKKAAKCGILALLLAASACWAADKYPDRPIRFIVPYPPGGTSDNVTRIVAAGVSERLGQPVIVENRGGAGTITGTLYVAKSEPDGYTFLATSTPLAINQTLYSSLPYKVPEEIKPVSLMAAVPLVMIVNPAAKAKSIQDLIKQIKAQPGKMTYGSSGIGGSPHLSMEMFLSQIGSKMVHVPYKGSAPAVMDLVAGQTDVVVDTLFLTQQQVIAGRARALAQLGVARSGLLPDVPTLQEAGLKGFDVSSWFMLAAPSRTPPGIIEKMNATINDVVQSKSVRDAFAQQGIEPKGGSLADTASFFDRQVRNFGDAVKRSGIKPE